MLGQRSLRAFVVTAACAAAASTFPATVSSGVVDNSRYDVAGTGGALNLCTGEWVNWTAGTLHGITVETGDVGRVKYLANFSGVRGVGDNGGEYVVVYANPVNLQADGAGGYTAIVSFKLIQLGSGEDYRQHQTGHLTITPDGRVVVEFYDLRENCGG
jgi:hypothetical protein